MADLDSILSGQMAIHIFGYASLTWKPDFEYDRSFVGYIKGYERKFWQGSTYHRGTEAHPGLCATLTPITNGTTWGLIYEISDAHKIAAALDYLNIREQKLGGYDVFVVPVYPREPQREYVDIYSVIYIATPECKGFLGDDTYERLANIIATSCGKIGHNIEYLIRLTDWMREEVPCAPDEHLYTLDRMVRGLAGMSEKGTEPWQELIKNPDFDRLVHPPKIDFKTLWKEAIIAHLPRKHEISRWSLLLLQIAKMKTTKARGLERIEFGNSLDIEDDEDFVSVKSNTNNNNNSISGNNNNNNDNNLNNIANGYIGDK